MTYDPTYLNDNNYNTAYTRVIDISKEQDFTIEIGIGREVNILPVLNTSSTLSTFGTAPITSAEDFANGTLSVSIVNELTVPNSTINNDIEVNVFVSMGDDFEVFVPSSSNTKLHEFQPQSGLEVPDAQKTSEPNAPEQQQIVTLGVGENYNPDMNKVFMGEAIRSFRPLLKRKELHERVRVADNSGNNSVFQFRRCAQPYFRGRWADTVHDSAPGVGYNYCNTLLYHWIRSCFAAHRGSMRYTALAHCRENNNMEMLVTRLGRYDDLTNTFASGLYLISPPTLTDAETAREVVGDLTATTSAAFPGYTAEGSAFTAGSVNPTLEFEMPYYNNYRFTPGKKGEWTGSRAEHTRNEPIYRIHGRSTNLTLSSTLDMFVSTGEDFQMYFWTGMPRVYRVQFTPIISS